MPICKLYFVFLFLFYLEFTTAFQFLNDDFNSTDAEPSENFTALAETIDVRQAELYALHSLLGDVGSRPAWLCQIVQVKNVYYYYGVIGDQYNYGINSLGSCLYQCVEHNRSEKKGMDGPKGKESADDPALTCKAVNYFAYHKACQLLSDGMESTDGVDKRLYGKMDGAVHAYIQYCYDPESDGSITQSSEMPRPQHTTTSSRPGSVGCGMAAYAPYLPVAKNRIIRGQEAKPHSWPWMVLFNLDMGSQRSFCGSTLLRVRDDVEESDIVMTAAHCVTRPDTQGSSPVGYDPAYMSVIAGNHRRSVRESGEAQRRVSEVRFHAGFRFTPFTGAVNDVALLKLQSPISFNEVIRPVCLPRQDDPIPSGLQCAAAGWGRNDSRSMYVMPDALQQLQVPLQDAQTCANSWPQIYREREMVCAGALSGTASTCQGDSGGMLACRNNAGQWVQHGITSFGVGGSCLQPYKPAVFARVSSYMDWIRKHALAMSSLTSSEKTNGDTKGN